MAPIRVGLIGLGPLSSPVYRAGEWGITHLKAINSSPHYQIVAVCNSTVESAQRSIEGHNLPSSVKAYGCAEDIARDPNVDLVVVVVSLDKHYQLVKPALQHKKNVIVEYPFTPDMAQTEELLALAKANGVKILVAAQARADPAMRKLKEIVDSKAIGDILYTSFSGQNSWASTPEWPAAASAFVDLDNDINTIDVLLGHPLDTFVHVLGGFQSLQTVFKTHLKSTQLVDYDGNIVDPDYKITAPGHMLLQGVLESGAAATFSIRTTPVIAEGPGYRWIITGSEGEVVFTSGAGIFQMNPPDAKIYLKKVGDAEAREVDFSRKESDCVANSETAVVNTLRLYEAFANADTDGFSTGEQTLETEKLMYRLKKEAVWAP